MLSRISFLNVRPVRTPGALMKWLSGASPGEVSVYHRGLLGADIEADGANPRSIAALSSLAQAAQQASDDGLVHLVQLRLSPGPFAYLAVRRSDRDTWTSSRSARLPPAHQPGSRPAP